MKRRGSSGFLCLAAVAAPSENTRYIHSMGSDGKRRINARDEISRAANRTESDT